MKVSNVYVLMKEKKEGTYIFLLPFIAHVCEKTFVSPLVFEIGWAEVPVEHFLCCSKKSSQLTVDCTGGWVSAVGLPFASDPINEHIIEDFYFFSSVLLPPKHHKD